jgi:hypothetical protein
MQTTTILGRDERERIRLAFFREYRDVPGFSSVSVRRHPDRREWCVYVGVSGNADLPANFRGLPVTTYESGVAVHAVAYPVA